MSAYSKQYAKLKSIDSYFTVEDGRRYFQGESLVVRIPQRLETHNLYTESDFVETLLEADLIVDDSFQSSISLLTKVQMKPSDISQMVYKGVPYKVLKFFRGDIFSESAYSVKDKNVVFALWQEYIDRGNIPYWYDWKKLNKLFDQSDEICDAKLPVNKAILSVVYSHVTRDEKDLFTQYRHTSMTDKEAFIGLRSVSHSPTSTTDRLMGSFQEEGMLSSLLNQSKGNVLFEDTLRGVVHKNTGIRQT